MTSSNMGVLFIAILAQALLIQAGALLDSLLHAHMVTKEGVSLTEAELYEIWNESEKHGFEIADALQHSCLIETGTLLGETVITLAHLFKEVHTIEIKEQCFLAARLASWRAKGPICFHHGASQQILPDLLPVIQAPSLIFLDAHFVGGPTGGDAPLLEEMLAIDQYLGHRALIVIDDFSMFGKKHTFDVCDRNLHFEEWRTIDWSEIDSKKVCSCLESDRIVFSYVLEQQDRFIIGLSQKRYDTTIPAVHLTKVGNSADYVFDHAHAWTTPDRPLNVHLLEELRSCGKGWAKLADSIAAEHHVAKVSCVPAAQDNQSARVLQMKRPVMTKEQAHQMEDALIKAYEDKEFQKRLRHAWDLAKGNKAKQIEVKQEMCWPIQLPIITKYRFEASKKGLLDCLTAARVYFENDLSLFKKGVYLTWLVNPDMQEETPEATKYYQLFSQGDPRTAKDWDRLKCLCGSLTEKDLHEIVEKASSHGFDCSGVYACLIETGTLIGGTVASLAHLFKEVHTIEIERPCFLAACLNSWTARGLICFHHGESTEILPELLPLIKGPSLIFLDAHFVGGPSGGGSPLLEEIVAINRYLEHPALLVIDDLSMFSTRPTFEVYDSNFDLKAMHRSDWTGINCERICSQLDSDRLAFSCMIEHQDRFVIGLSKKSVTKFIPSTHVGHLEDYVFKHRCWKPTCLGLLDPQVLQDLRSCGTGWARLADNFAAEHFWYFVGENKSSVTQTQSDRPRLTKEQASELQDEFIRAYEQTTFQEQLHHAYNIANGSKGKLIKAKQETCWPIQQPILTRYGFEASRKGLVECLVVVRVYYETDELNHWKGNYVGWLVAPPSQRDPAFGDYARIRAQGINI